MRNSVRKKAARHWERPRPDQVRSG